MDFPLPQGIVDPIFFSTAAEYRRLTGKAPIRSSGVMNPSGVDGPAAPVWVNRPFTVKRLYAFNGAVVGGANTVSIVLMQAPSAPAAYLKPYRVITGAMQQTPSGTNVWQSFDVTDAKIPPGLYWLGLVTSSATHQVMRLETQTTSNVLGVIAGAFRLNTGVPFTTVDDAYVTPPDDTYGYPLLAMGGIA
ncbi:MAG TPA: hypothetical protein VIU40_13920 [Geobacteraceae bacterium]